MQSEAEEENNVKIVAADESITEEKAEPVAEKIEVKESPKSKILALFNKLATGAFVVQSWQVIVAAVLVLAMVGGGVALGVVLSSQNSDFNDSPVDFEWVLPEGGYVTEGQIVLPGYDVLTFPAGEREIEIVLPNAKENPCYFRYTLVLEETGEVLYQSKLIPPGKAVLEIKLSRPLPKGDYALLIGIDSFSLVDGSTPMNGGEVRVLLKVR